jgi:hypothetical protein
LVVRKSTALSLALAALTGCIPLGEQKKGEQDLGDFRFLATAVEDSCLSVRYGNSLTFPANLSRTQETFFFSGPGGVIAGTIVGKTFTVTFGGTETIDAACAVTRDETLSGTLETSSATGTYLIRILPVQGANCLAAVASRQFATLPCAVRYQVSAERTDTPDGGASEDGGM